MAGRAQRRRAGWSGSDNHYGASAIAKVRQNREREETSMETPIAWPSFANQKYLCIEPTGSRRAGGYSRVVRGRHGISTSIRSAMRQGQENTE